MFLGHFRDFKLSSEKIFFLEQRSSLMLTLLMNEIYTKIKTLHFKQAYMFIYQHENSTTPYMSVNNDGLCG